MAEQIKLLFVDDEINVLKALRRLFIDEDCYDIHLANSGEEGLAMLKEEPEIRLIISDYRMPKMNGVEFLTQACELYSDTIRIVLSGYADTAAVVSAINLGQIYKFIPKPWNDEELKSTIKSALHHQELQWQNRLLNSELQQKNQMLEGINDKLEHQVAKRTEALEIRNRALQISQTILDVLTVAVFGIDAEQMIVQCNEAARGIFYSVAGDPLGHHCSEVFSEELNRFLGDMEELDSLQEPLQINGKGYRVNGQRLRETPGQGIVLELIREES
jgi:two-component system NtrC family sensor kinase